MIDVKRTMLMRFVAVVAFLMFAAVALPVFQVQAAYGLEAASAPQLRVGQSYTIDEVCTLIEALPAVTAVTEDDAPAIQQARDAYDQLDADERALLDTETNRAALGTTQSYGRVLELAEAGLAVLRPIDDSTMLADGLYTTNLSMSWDRGKSASKQDREWTAVDVRVASGKSLVTLRVNSPTYSQARAGGQVCARLSKSASDESLFLIPVSLGKRMTFTAYSQTMATEIAYNLFVSVADGAQPDAALPSGEDEPGADDSSEPDESLTPIVQVDGATGDAIVERGTFAHPEIKGYMFRIVEPSLVMSNGENMTVYAEMPSQSYTHFFVGTAEQASKKTLEEGVADGSFIPAVPVVNAAGATVNSFTFPLASLNRDIDVCLFSDKNQYWVDHTIRYNSEDLTWYEADGEQEQLASVIELLQNLPARNTIVPDNAQHEATVRAARAAYESLNRLQKSKVPARLVLLLEWDESMFDLGFNTEFLPLALAGKAYDGAVYVSGKNGTSGKTIRVSKGSLPAGLSLEMDEAGLWASFVGVPEENGSSTFTVELSNDLGERVSKEFTIHVGYAPRIMTDTFADAKVGVPYRESVAADAYPDATWSLVEGSLPTGLSFSDDGDAANTAHISGTPTQAGSFSFTLACDNFANGVERREYTIEVAPDDRSQTDAEISSLKQALADVETRLAQQAQTIAEMSAKIAKLESKLPTKVMIDAKTVAAKTVKKALKKARNPHATKVVLTGKVMRIRAGAFKGTDVRTLVVKTTKLTKKSVKGSLKGSKVKTIRVSTAESKLAKTIKKYTKAFSKKNAGRKVVVR